MSITGGTSPFAVGDGGPASPAELGRVRGFQQAEIVGPTEAVRDLRR